MNLRSIVLTCLSAAPAGCISTCGCDPPSERFELDRDVTGADLAHAWLDPDPATWTCDELCDLAYMAERGWFATEVGSCTHTLGPADPSTLETADTAAPQVVAHVTCAGEGIEYYCEGRRPHGHRERPTTGRSAVGRVLAGVAHLEAASVVAFEELADALVRFGATEDLVARCREAARDEVRHARMMTALARRHGGEVPQVRTRRARPTLTALARHNAVEGCVHEAWGVVELCWQASHAVDPAVRAVARSVAPDELRHGQLAWDLHAWLLPRLSPRARRLVERHQARALARLPDRVAAGAARMPPELGLLDVARGRALAERFAGQVKSRSG